MEQPTEPTAVNPDVYSVAFKEFDTITEQDLELAKRELQLAAEKHRLLKELRKVYCQTCELQRQRESLKLRLSEAPTFDGFPNLLDILPTATPPLMSSLHRQPTSVNTTARIASTHPSLPPLPGISVSRSQMIPTAETDGKRALESPEDATPASKRPRVCSDGASTYSTGQREHMGDMDDMGVEAIDHVDGHAAGVEACNTGDNVELDNGSPAHPAADVTLAVSSLDAAHHPADVAIQAATLGPADTDQHVDDGGDESTSDDGGLSEDTLVLGDVGEMDGAGRWLIEDVRGHAGATMWMTKFPRIKHTAGTSRRSWPAGFVFPDDVRPSVGTGQQLGAGPGTVRPTARPKKKPLPRSSVTSFKTNFLDLHREASEDEWAQLLSGSDPEAKRCLRERPRLVKAILSDGMRKRAELRADMSEQPRSSTNDGTGPAHHLNDNVGGDDDDEGDDDDDECGADVLPVWTDAEREQSISVSLEADGAQEHEQSILISPSNDTDTAESTRLDAHDSHGACDTSGADATVDQHAHALTGSGKQAGLVAAWQEADDRVKRAGSKWLALLGLPSMEERKQALESVLQACHAFVCSNSSNGGDASGLESKALRGQYAEALTLINQRMDQVKAAWHSKQLPSLQCTAARIWKEGRQRTCLGGRVWEDWQDRMELLLGRLPGLCNAAATELACSRKMTPRLVAVYCRNMELTVEEVCEMQYKVQVAQLEERPAAVDDSGDHVDPGVQPQKRSRVMEVVEGEGSEGCHGEQGEDITEGRRSSGHATEPAGQHCDDSNDHDDAAAKEPDNTSDDESGYVSARDDNGVASWAGLQLHTQIDDGYGSPDEVDNGGAATPTSVEPTQGMELGTAGSEEHVGDTRVSGSCEEEGTESVEEEGTANTGDGSGGSKPRRGTRKRKQWPTRRRWLESDSEGEEARRCEDVDDIGDDGHVGDDGDDVEMTEVAAAPSTQLPDSSPSTSPYKACHVPLDLQLWESDTSQELQRTRRSEEGEEEEESCGKARKRQVSPDGTHAHADAADNDHDADASDEHDGNAAAADDDGNAAAADDDGNAAADDDDGNAAADDDVSQDLDDEEEEDDLDDTGAGRPSWQQRRAAKAAETRQAQAAEARIQQKDRLQAAKEDRLRRRRESGGGTGPERQVDVDVRDKDARPLFPGGKDKDEQVLVPGSIACKLKDHQWEGVQFMWAKIVQDYKVSEDGNVEDDDAGGCILAHSMGLGKTLQTITFLLCYLDYFPQQKVLLLVPACVLLNWEHEFKTWLPQRTPGLSFSKIMVCQSESDLQVKATVWADTDSGVLITTFNLFKRHWKSGDKLLTDTPHVVVADEAHVFKSREGDLYKAASAVATKKRIALTGYPLQNNLDEYYTMISWCRGDLLGTPKEFKALFAIPIGKGQHANASKEETLEMNESLGVLNDIVGDYIDRRGPELLERDLPPKFEHTILLNMHPLQAKAYQQLLAAVSEHRSLFRDKNLLDCISERPSEYRKELEGLVAAAAEATAPTADAPVTAQPQTASGTVAVQTGGVESGGPGGQVSLGEIQRLDSVASSERDAAEGGAEAAEDVGAADVANKKGRGSHLPEAVVQSLLFQLDAAEKEAGTTLVDITTPKHDVLLQLVEQCTADQAKLVLFAESLDTLAAIETHFQKRYGWHCEQDYLKLGGNTPSSKRHKDINRFNCKRNTTLKVLLCSTRALSHGVNLQGVARMVIMDEPWNPVYNLQAVNRIYRYGQGQHSHVLRLHYHNNCQYRIYRRNVEKAALFKRVVDKQPVAQSSTEEERCVYAHEPAPQLPEKHADTLLASLEATTVNRQRAAVLIALLQRCCRDGSSLRTQLVNVFDHQKLLQQDPKQVLNRQQRKAARDRYIATTTNTRQLRRLRRVMDPIAEDVEIEASPSLGIAEGGEVHVAVVSAPDTDHVGTAAEAAAEAGMVSAPYTDPVSITVEAVPEAAMVPDPVNDPMSSAMETAAEAAVVSGPDNDPMSTAAKADVVSGPDNDPMSTAVEAVEAAVASSSGVEPMSTVVEAAAEAASDAVDTHHAGPSGSTAPAELQTHSAQSLAVEAEAVQPAPQVEAGAEQVLKEQQAPACEGVSSGAQDHRQLCRLLEQLHQRKRQCGLRQEQPKHALSKPGKTGCNSMRRNCCC